MYSFLSIIINFLQCLKTTFKTELSLIFLIPNVLLFFIKLLSKKQKDYTLWRRCKETTKYLTKKRNVSNY